jgi:hypothetical protein
MTRLPDEVLMRSDGAGRRTYHYNGRAYLAVSAWTSKDEARAAAASIRGEGGRARAIPAIRPILSMPANDRLDPRHEAYLGRPWRRHTKTRNRWMWLVFAAEPVNTEIAAHAGGRTGGTP